MEFYPTNEYREVTLQVGLNSVQLGNTDKLFSDGLEEDEYIYFDDSKGFCYEDGCVIGGTYDQTLKVLYSQWGFDHKFYVKRTEAKVIKNYQKTNNVEFESPVDLMDAICDEYGWQWEDFYYDIEIVSD